jgi:hypothetical protein
VPPDLVATLLFGRFGALELERRHDDVMFGRYRDVAAALFPAVPSDMVSIL